MSCWHTSRTWTRRMCCNTLWWDIDSITQVHKLSLTGVLLLYSCSLSLWRETNVQKGTSVRFLNLCDSCHPGRSTHYSFLSGLENDDASVLSVFRLPSSCCAVSRWKVSSQTQFVTLKVCLLLTKETTSSVPAGDLLKPTARKFSLAIYCWDTCVNLCATLTPSPLFRFVPWRRYK